MTFYESLPQDIHEALYDYCKDDECLNDACLRALRNELKIKPDEPNRYSHDCPRCDKYNNLKETLAQTIENDEVAYETLKLHDQEEIGMLNSKITKLEQQIEKMKCCYNCSKWNDGECEESPKSKTFFCADFKCDKWECIE